MVRIQAETAGGCLRRLSISGHGPATREGASLPCGIVSALGRTAARMLEKQNEIQWSGDAPEPGALWIVIENIPEGLIRRMEGITDFLLAGFGDVADDFPDIVQLTVTRT